MITLTMINITHSKYLVFLMIFYALSTHKDKRQFVYNLVTFWQQFILDFFSEIDGLVIDEIASRFAKKKNESLIEKRIT